MSWTAFPFSREALAAALVSSPGALFICGCTESTNLTGSNGAGGTAMTASGGGGTGTGGAAGMGGPGATGATGGSSMGGSGMGGSGMGGSGGMAGSGMGGSGGMAGSGTSGSGGQQVLQCGNGILDPGESCDDGNMMDGDACPASCLRPVTKLAAGGWFTCAVLDDSRLKCWGGNGHGSLGLGDLANRGDGPGEMGDNLPAVDLGAGKTVVAMAPAFYSSCALLNDGRVKCWGLDYVLGQGIPKGTGDVGDAPGEMGDNLPEVDLGTGQTAVDVRGGQENHCAILTGGSVKCWGVNGFGELGLGDTNNRGDEPGEMGDNLPAVDLGTGKTAVQLALGALHTCALLNDGKVKCWGRSVVGQLGLGDTNYRGNAPGQMGDNLPEVDLGTGKTAVAISAGAASTCVILNDGSVKCWGSNAYGALGLGDTNHRGDTPGEMGDNLPAVALGAGKTAVAIAVGNFYACAILNDGSIKCWGANAYGQLGLGDTNHRGDEPGEMGDNLPALDLGAGMTGLSISTRGNSPCALLSGGRLKCWGNNGEGQLGLGDTNHRGDDPGEMGDALPFVAP